METQFGTKVVNHNAEPYDVYIGRPTKWGNPFSHKKGTKAQFIVGSREEAVAKFMVWITSGEGKHLMNDLHELKGKTLGCWCSPKLCHGHVLALLADTQEEVEQKTLF